MGATVDRRKELIEAAAPRLETVPVMLSAIVPAHNEARLIRRTLEALVKAGAAVGERFARTFEIIVADDASTDATAAIARGLGARVVAVTHRRISSVRNAGARAASGEYLVFVDADTIVPPETLVAAVAAMDSGAVGGGAYTRFDRPIPAWSRALEPVANWIYRRARLASGCFTFCRREVFEAVGGYDENLVAAEEAALSRAIRGHGRLVVLQEHVVSSGRKLRTYSAREILGLIGRLAVRPRSGLRDPELWGILYRPRRPDPLAPDGGDREPA